MIPSLSGLARPWSAKTEAVKMAVVQRMVGLMFEWVSLVISFDDLS